MSAKSKRLHWSRRDGLSIKPDRTENWKVAGGYTYAITVGANGSTVIMLVQNNNRPLRCKATASNSVILARAQPGSIEILGQLAFATGLLGEFALQ